MYDNMLGDSPIQGISTMKAFALANAQGQKMYTISKQNIDKVLPMIQASALTKGDIRNAVNAGKIVTVHEREVSVPGWRGTGYMVFDPASGNNAFMISGGGNGGHWYDRLSTTQALLLNLLNSPYVRLPVSVLVRVVGAVVSIIDRIHRCSHGLNLAIMALMIVFMAQISTIVVLLTALVWSSTFLTGLAIMSMATITGIMNLEMDRHCGK